MRWIIFTGTWRLTNSAVERDVRESARHVFERGDGLVTGGGTGVDYFAMDEFIALDPTCERIRVFIPAKLNHYIADYRTNWKHSPITDGDIDKLEHVLTYIKGRNPPALIEADRESGDITQAMYDLRHNEEVAAADEVYAFQVNESTGTADTIRKARERGLAIALHKTYAIASE
jgi:CO dehydrogenase/acetyl-CoA synthase beta subunit